MRWALLAWLAMGCNQLIGVHEYGADAASDACPGCQCTIDSDCTDLHAVCDNSQCTCSAGYALGSDGCVWVGVIDDPGFERSPDRWTQAIGQTTLTPSAPQASGMQDPGYVAFPEDATCHFGTLTQPVTMPRFSRSESLVVSATYAYQGTIIIFGNGTYPTVGIGSSFYEGSYPQGFPGYTPRRMCLGPGQYAPETSTGVGAGVAVELTAHDVSCFGGGTSQAFTFDHVEILPAAPDECPLPGQVTNGDAEGTGGWRFVGNAAIQPCPTTGHCIAITETKACDPASARVLLSVPVATTTLAAAVSIDHSAAGTANPTDLALGLDTGIPLQVGTGATESYCLPAYMRGGVYPLATSSSRCVDGGTLYVDNVTVMNVPACAGSPYLSDPSFESGFQLVDAGHSPFATAAIELDPSGAFAGGTHDLHLQVVGACGSYSYWRALPTVPASFGRPALKFHYRWVGKTSATFATAPATLTPTGSETTWTASEICLDPKLAGRPQQVTFEVVQPSPTTCPNTVESVYLDELSVVDEPNCPAPP